MKTTNNNSFTATGYNFTEVLASLVKSYKTTSALKKDYKSLVNLYGKDEAIRLLKAYKDNKANEVSMVADEARGHLTTEGVMNYAYKELSKGGAKNGALARLQSLYAQSSSAINWEDFLSKYYPHTMEATGAPAQRVLYTRDGSEVYAVYEPIKLTPENAIKVLMKSLSNLEKGAQRVWINNKPRLTFTEAHKAGSITEVWSSKVVREVLKDEEGKVISDKYKLAKIEKVEFPEGLGLTEEHISVKEFISALNAELNK